MLGIPASVNAGTTGPRTEERATQAEDDLLSGGVVDGVEPPELLLPEEDDAASSSLEGAMAQALPPPAAPGAQPPSVNPLPGEADAEKARRDAEKRQQQRPGQPQDDSLGENPDALDDKPKSEVQTIRVIGRVSARARADERNQFQRRLSIADARVGVSTSLANLEAEVTADLADSQMLKDAFVRLADDNKRFRLYGGQFKTPFLQRSLESSWDLPIQSRGLVEEYITETHQMGGRRMGLMGEVRLKNVWKLKISAGFFQGAIDEAGARLKEDAAARVSVRPFNFKPLTVGVSTYVSEAMDLARKHAVAADAELKLAGFVFTGEAISGRLPMGPFTAQMLLAQYLIHVGDEWAIQPVAGVEALQLRGDTVRGDGHSLVGGFNVLLGTRFRAQFQTERALRPGDEFPGLQHSIELGARF
ncbi:hypothetical protein LILAB_20600 [Corallococcus macrosporus]|uniref:Uncharacterized protein n=1 Tax=Myxococcus fulvus (strain ATCC BAA-855 / HW-1) TaxID=483219 RepID=F8CDA3_MYXFH|nr:hypothetical protein LILAB_20600 [Corallococcus macrosporus]